MVALLRADGHDRRRADRGARAPGRARAAAQRAGQEVDRLHVLVPGPGPPDRRGHHDRRPARRATAPAPSRPSTTWPRPSRSSAGPSSRAWRCPGRSCRRASSRAESWPRASFGRGTSSPRPGWPLAVRRSAARPCPRRSATCSCARRRTSDRARARRSDDPARRRSTPRPGSSGRCRVAVLPIQGPPGSGKTYTGARMIVDLVAEGKRVGVVANSHKVIGKVLDEVAKAAIELGAARPHRPEAQGRPGPDARGRASCSRATRTSRRRSGRAPSTSSAPWPGRGAGPSSRGRSPCWTSCSSTRPAR